MGKRGKLISDPVTHNSSAIDHVGDGLIVGQGGAKAIDQKTRECVHLAAFHAVIAVVKKGSAGK